MSVLTAGAPPPATLRNQLDTRLERLPSAEYADQNEPDHKALVDAVASGRVTAEPDLSDPGPVAGR